MLKFLRMISEIALVKPSDIISTLLVIIQNFDKLLRIFKHLLCISIGMERTIEQVLDLVNLGSEHRLRDLEPLEDLGFVVVDYKRQ